MDETDRYPHGRDLEEVLRSHLGSAQKKNLEVYVGNERTTLEDALDRCVQERTIYMPDYILDENGILEQLRFDRIDLQ